MAGYICHDRTFDMPVCYEPELPHLVPINVDVYKVHDQGREHSVPLQSWREEPGLAPMVRPLDDLHNSSAAPFVAG